MRLRNLPVVFLTIFLLSALSVFAQTVSCEPEAPDIRRMLVGRSQDSVWSGALGQQGQNSIYMQSFGDESYVSFTINWDPRQLIFLNAVNGTDLPVGSQITLNRSRLALGSLGITITSPQTFRKGSINLANLGFVTPQDAPLFGTGLPVTFTSDPTPQITRGDNGAELSTIYVNSSTLIVIADPNTAFGIGGGQTLAGQMISIPMAMSEIFSPFTGQTSFRFSIEWDSTRFSFVNASLGNGIPVGGTLALDTSQLSEGRLGLIVNGTSPLPPNSQSLTIANVLLAVSPQAGNGRYPVFFTSSPVPYSVLDVQGNPAPFSARSAGFINIGTTTSVTGVVRRPTGQPLANTTVQLRQGNTRLTAVTSSFGVFTFPSVPFGRSYTLNVVSKRFRFPGTPIFVSSATDVELKGLE